SRAAAHPQRLPQRSADLRPAGDPVGDLHGPAGVHHLHRARLGHLRLERSADDLPARLAVLELREDLPDQPARRLVPAELGDHLAHLGAGPGALELAGRLRVRTAARTGEEGAVLHRHRDDDDPRADHDDPAVLDLQRTGLGGHVPAAHRAAVLLQRLHIFLVRQFVTRIPYEMDEAAQIDGLGHFGIYARLILPMMTPILIAI